MDKHILGLFIDFLKNKHNTWYADDFKEGSRVFRLSGCQSVNKAFPLVVTTVSIRGALSLVSDFFERNINKAPKSEIAIEDVTDALIAEFQILYSIEEDKP